MSRTYFFWDPLSDNILQERDESGTVTAEYTTEPRLYGNLISQNRGGVESQYHFDSQGSTLALTDDNQQVTDTYAYTAFGEITEHSGNTVTPFQYFGKNERFYSDIVGNFLASRTRPYDPFKGIWMGSTPSESTHSPYAYIAHFDTIIADDNPIDRVNWFTCSGSRRPGSDDYCFNAGADLSNPACKKQKLVPYGSLCYSYADYLCCISRLRFRAWLATSIYPCAAKLLKNFLDPAAKANPYCPSECIDEINKSDWILKSARTLIGSALKWPLPCCSSGKGASSMKYGGPCQDPFKGNNYGLEISIGAIDSAALSLQTTYKCDSQKCCRCDLAWTLSYTITDTYDFISTVEKKDVPLSEPWCAAVIENAQRRWYRGTSFMTGRPFTTLCSGTQTGSGVSRCPNNFSDLTVENNEPVSSSGSSPGPVN